METMQLIVKAIEIAFWSIWESLAAAIAVSCTWIGFVEILRRLP